MTMPTTDTAAAAADGATPAPESPAPAAENAAPAADGAAPAVETAAPPAPERLADTGLSGERLRELVLKTLYVQGARTGRRLAEDLRLPFRIIDPQVMMLQRRHLLEVQESAGLGRGSYRFALTGAGRDRAREALSSSQYVGPAPVPLDQYRRVTGAQSIAGVQVNREDVRQGFSNLVLDRAVLEALGPGINSARSIFLHGKPGNGKTLIAETIPRLLGDAIFLPYAIDVNGQIITVHDPVYHKPADGRGAADGTRRRPDAEHERPPRLERPPAFDQRFARVRRPVIMTGGELTMEQLDLRYDPHTKLYEAPFQMKANGGVLIVDDFGRQRVPPRELLNRWIVPLEKRIDFMTLHTGGKFPVPFDCLLVFATNIDPEDLVEEAFMRRIHYKIHVGSPDPAQYREIFRRACAERGVPYDEGAVRHIYGTCYDGTDIQPRGCHPRDLLEHVRDIARFLETDPVLSKPLIDRAARTYFLTGPGTPGRPGSE